MKHIYKIALTVVLSSCLLFTTGCSMLGISGNAFSKFESSHEGFFKTATIQIAHCQMRFLPSMLAAGKLQG